MASGGPFKTGAESQDSNEPAPPGTSGFEQSKLNKLLKVKPSLLRPTTKGVENAKKRLRAFAIQKKKIPIVPPVVIPKPASTGNATVLIGKLTSVKTTPKPEKVEDDSKKQPKPPKPGASKFFQESYTEVRKKTLAEIEDMKRKMELVDLGIPLGLICPTTNEKAMPTKAMPPIKSFLEPSKVDELIREAKKARAEGKEFKFDYHKLLPDYDNPFQRKKEDMIPERKDIVPEIEAYDETRHRKSKGDRERRISERYDRKHEYKKDDKGKFDKAKDKDDGNKESAGKFKDKEDIDRSDDKSSENLSERDGKETDLNLNDYVVCDSWSLDNDEKNSSSPQVEEKVQKVTVSTPKDTKNLTKDPVEKLRDYFPARRTPDKPVDSPKIRIKIEKLKPVMDSFKFEIDPNDDEALDMFDENTKLEKYSQCKPPKDTLYNSPIIKFDYERDISKDTSMGDVNDETFLESVINEIKQETMSDDENQDKGLVEYDSPSKEYEDSASQEASQGSVTPELDDRVMRDYEDSSRSHDSGRKSTESCKSMESGYKSNESYKDSLRSNNFHLTMEKEEHEVETKISKSIVDSLETWSFVLKICQPLLFRHDKNKCYKETRAAPKLWYTESPKLCSCVKDRTVVYEELEMCKMNLVYRVYSCKQVADPPPLAARTWYPPDGACLAESPDSPVPPYREAERSPRDRADPPAAKQKPQRWSMTPERSEVEVLDREYQRFMEAVWPEVTEPKPTTSRSTTPVKQEVRKKKVEKDKEEAKKKEKKIKLSSEGWSPESDLEEEVETSKKQKAEKKVRKRKRSVSPLSAVSDSEDGAKKKKKLKKKTNKNAKAKLAKRTRLGKKLKLKDKLKTKKRRQVKIEESELDEDKEIKKKEKLKKKKQQKVKKKAEKKRKARAKSSSSSDSSSSSESSTESESEVERRARKAKRKEEEARKKKKKEKKKKRRKSTSDSAQSEELFDMNVLNNIKTERLTDEEKPLKDQEIRKHREIINVKELHEDFSNVQVKQELEDARRAGSEAGLMTRFEVDEIQQHQFTEVQDKTEKVEFKEPQDIPLTAQPIRPVTDESNLSQCSSQESVCSVKDTPAYEKDESHLRPSSQNSNYSFNDVISASQSGLYPKGMEEEEKFENYEHGNYEMYEHLAMAYQSDVASQQISPPSCSGEQRIETVVRARSRGEIKCDWRAGDGPSPRALPPHPHPPRPSRWGLKPGEVNIVLTGGGDASPEPAHAHALAPDAPQPVYQIQSLANRTDNSATGYDEAYADMYGASDRLQYGDCFSSPAQGPAGAGGAAGAGGRRSLDARIHQALRDSVLGEVAKETLEIDGDVPDKGILVTKSLGGRAAKRVSFADGYKPGQDSDTEGPPVKKRKKSRRVGCAWPCPATHPDHVPLWDALPPPPPPPGSPPPPPARAPPLHLLRAARHTPPTLLPAPPHMLQHKFDPSVAMANFMPPEPPPGLITFP